MDNLKILGRVIGTYNGWDGDVECMTFYDFDPTYGVAIPKHDHLSVVYTEGTFEQCDDQGNHIWSADIIDTIKDLPKQG